MIENIESFTFNGVDIAEEFTNEDAGEYLIVNSVSGRGLLPAAPNLITVTRRHGAYFESSYLPERILDITLTLKSESFSKLRKDIEKLNGIINTGEEGEIVFADEPDRVYYGTVAEVSSETEISHIAAISFVFVCADPFKYGEEKTLNFPSTGILTLDNEGTAETEPVFELTAKDKATFAMVANSEGEYNLIGKPATVTEQVVDTRNLLFEEDGSTLSSWTSAGTSVDGGEVAGSFGTDGAGITVPNYGTGSAWHGPAAIKEITPVQDFEVKAHLQMRTSIISQTSRVEVYLYDENMDVLGKMAVMDNMLNQYTKKGEARFGPFVGRHTNYLISSDNYQYAWDYFFGMLRIRRVGNEFEFYITRIATNTNHVYSLKKTYKDDSGELMGRLKYVQIHIGTHGDTGRAYSAKFFSVSAYELSQATEDQTPYIIDIGDVVTFDHKTKDILLNGESRKDLKNFGGSLFALEKGTNTLSISPEGTFDASIKYRNKYL